MKKWLFLAALLLGTAAHAQTDSLTTTTAESIDKGALKAELKGEIKKELATEVKSVVDKMDAANKKESEELKFKIKELEEKMKKEIEISEKQKFEQEQEKEAKLKISGITFLRTRNVLTKTETGSNTVETSDHYLLGMARVDFEKQVTNEVRANLRLATDGVSNLVKLTGNENGTITRPDIVVDHAYMTVDAKLTSNKVGMIYQKTSAAKDNYYASTTVGDEAYIAAGKGYYSDDLRNTLVGVRSEISFDESFGLNLTVAKNENKGAKVTVNDSVTVENKDLFTLIAEFPMEFGGVKLVPEGLIGIEDEMKNITAGMDIIIPTSFAQFGVSGAGSFNEDNDTKNGLVTLSAKIPVYKSKSVSFVPYFAYRASGETQDNFSKESLLVQHYLDFRFKTTYKKFSIRPRYRTYIRPNSSVTMEHGGSDYTEHRFECDFAVKF